MAAAANTGSLQLHPIQHVINVQWGGAIIVVKTVNSEIHRGQIAGPTKEAVDSGKWTFLNSPFGITAGGSSNNGASYALIDKGDNKKEQVFVLSAQNEDGNGNSAGVILFSTNGADWKIVFSQSEVNDGDVRDPWIFEPTGIVWDETDQAFYAAFYAARFTQIEGGVDVDEGESIHRSSDGRKWTRVSYKLQPEGDLTTDSPSLLDSHCTKPENKGNIPDGLQAYNKSSGLFMKPTSLGGFNIFNGASYTSSASTVDIEYDEPDDEKQNATVSVGFPCYAVAQISGIWIATGGEQNKLMKIAVSIDHGETWETVKTAGGTDEGNTGACVIAGQKKTTKS